MTNKKFTKLLCAAVASASLLFGGCSQIAEEDSQAPVAASEENKPAAVAEKTIIPTAAQNAPAITTNVRNTPVVQVAKNVGPTVVGITNKAVALDFFNNQVETEGVGSGVIFRNDGYIVTNNHVVANSRELIVSLADGNSVPGTLVGADEMTDIAVVKIDMKDLPTAHFGNSDEIMVGEPVVAIGNPMGLEFQGSVTVGVISALNRTLELDDKRFKLIQTDAAISPGNSGGALVNYDGEIIGINSAKLARSGVEGMAFAIPINTVQYVINELMEKGYVARPYLGVTIFDKPTAARYGYQLNISRGVYVFQVSLNSPAGRAGIQRGDIILSLDDKPVNSVNEIRADIAARKVGDTVKIVFDRDGSQQTLSVVLQEMPQPNN